MRNVYVTLFTILAASTGRGAVQTKTIEYDAAGVKCKGVLMWDDTVKEKRPGVLVIHEWWGLNDYAKKRTEMLAKEGYVAFAADLYGDGMIAQHPEDAKKFMMAVRENEKTWLARAEAAYKALEAQPQVDASKIGAIGYCFGGTTALILAMSGADVKCTVTFHAGMPSASAEQAKKVSGKVVICHGAADDFVTMDSVKGYLKAFDDAGNKNYELKTYAGATHSFTVEGIEKKMPMLKYDAEGDKQSWEAMLKVFKETLK